MKVINSETGFLTYQKIFSHLQANHSPIVVWQFQASSGKRLVSESRLNSYHMESKLIHLDSSGVEVDFTLPVYCYAETGQLIFKTTVHEVKDSVFSLAMPKEIKLLEDSECQEIKVGIGIDLGHDITRVKRLGISGIRDREPDFMKVKSMMQRSSRDKKFLSDEFGLVSVDEEDKLFAGKRETPRARPKVDKWVKVKSMDAEKVYRLKLFDLSQGGMGFVTPEMGLFPKGSTVHVIGFDEFDLDDPLVAQVVSHRPIDETQLEWKVGCKFEEGQS